ncbi:MAG: CPBP family intramembrane metalloprotease [Treponema sp.]|nr:CPBP family intramembrane metalloprotease [Treponema sp.]
MENKSYPRIKNAILLCLLLLGIQLGAGLIFGIFLGLYGLENESMINGIGLIFISLLTFGLVILIGYRKSHKSFNEVFMFNNVQLNLWIAVIVFMFGFVILSSELDNLLNYVLPMPEFLQDVFNSMLANEYIILSIILVGIIPAFVEEMFFRGVILSGFKENYSQKKAIIVSSLLFGIIHLNPWQFVTAFIIGLISAWICLQTKSILPSIYMHLFNNMLSVLVMKYGGIISIKGFNTAYYERSFQPLWFNAVGIILTGIGVLLFINSIKKAKYVT